MPEQEVQVNLEDHFVNDTIEKYLKKTEQLQIFKDRLTDIMSKIEDIIRIDTKDIA